MERYEQVLLLLPPANIYSLNAPLSKNYNIFRDQRYIYSRVPSIHGHALVKLKKDLSLKNESLYFLLNYDFQLLGSLDFLQSSKIFPVRPDVLSARSDFSRSSCIYRFRRDYSEPVVISESSKNFADQDRFLPEFFWFSHLIFNARFLESVKNSLNRARVVSQEVPGFLAE